jgi:hypothetical protein
MSETGKPGNHPMAWVENIPKDRTSQEDSNSNRKKAAYPFG